MFTRVKQDAQGDGQAPVDRSGTIAADVQDVAVEQGELSVEFTPDSFLAVVSRRQDHEIGAQDSKERAQEPPQER